MLELILDRAFICSLVVRDGSCPIDTANSYVPAQTHAQIIVS
jgi:hypothetical protein